MLSRFETLGGGRSQIQDKAGGRIGGEREGEFSLSDGEVWAGLFAAEVDGLGARRFQAGGQGHGERAAGAALFPLTQQGAGVAVGVFAKRGDHDSLAREREAGLTDGDETSPQGGCSAKAIRGAPLVSLASHIVLYGDAADMLLFAAPKPSNRGLAIVEALGVRMTA